MRELDPKWTAAQRDAIRSRGETLLVSAAAGSGKTAVLTERIIDRLLDETHALDLSTVLIVTFTKAAAAELKNRIRDALHAALLANPGRRRLETQLLQIGNARICTIDSFCLDLIRSHFETLSLSPKVAVADEAQAKLLAKTVMNQLIDAYFDGETGEADEPIAAFGAFTDLFVSSRSSDTLGEVFLSLRDTLNGYEEGIDYLLPCIRALRRGADTDFFAEDLPQSAPIRAALAAFASDMEKAYAPVLDFLDTDALHEKNYGPCMRYENAWTKELSAMLSAHAPYETVRTHFRDYQAPRMKSGIRGEKATEDTLFCKRIHDAFAEERKALAARYFAMPQEDLAMLSARQADVLENLHRFLSAFERRLSIEKAHRQLLDFGDMGRLALRLLWDAEKKEPTPAARQEAEKYTDIFIDEYQDVSPVQDRIFSSIAKGDNRFMVGDAKQSIYAFRGASPALFLQYRADFAEHPEHGRTIFLSDNFRCDEHIIRFANMVFSVLFSGSGIPYTEDDALLYSKKAEGEPVQNQVTLALLRTNLDEADTDTDTDETGDGGADAGLYTEADYIADTVDTLLKTGRKRDGSRIRPSDIAVLVRSARSSAVPIADALTRHGIPSFNNVSRAFFENAEVLLMYSLITVIDNPQKDVFLAGTLKSPLFRVTLDELVHIRRTCPEGSLYDALCSFTEETGFQKGRYFLDRLAYYRHRSRGMPVDRFLWMLYQDTGIFSLIYEREKRDRQDEETDPVQMRANLMMFYEYARAFEKGSFQGLCQFVTFIGDVIEEKAQLPPVMLSGEDADVVHILTIHQSKGLEFPVCFLAGLGKKANDADLKKPVLLDHDAGIATFLRDDTGFARINHPVRESVRTALADRQAEEEMRVLYVALTRAREQLYLSASVKEPKTLLDSFDHAGELLSSRTLHGENRFLSWILTAHAVTPSFDGLTVLFPERPASADAVSPDTAGGGAEPSLDGLSYAAAKKLLSGRFSYVYPYLAETKLPAKLSVSELLARQAEEEKADTSPDGQTISASETASSGKEPKEQASEPVIRAPRPAFMRGPEETDSAAERGTATHIFMQFCDYRRLAEQGVDAEIETLLSKGFFDRETAGKIDRRTLAAFTKSRLFAELLRAKTVRRELRFNFNAPVRPSDPDSTAVILVQGVMDCLCTMEDGRVVLIDYKTDHFSGERRRNAEDILKERHVPQLACYRMAAEQMLCRPLDDVRIYSFALGRDFSVMQETGDAMVSASSASDPS